MEPRIGLEPTTYSLRVRLETFRAFPGLSREARGYRVSLPSLSGTVPRNSGLFRCGGDQEVITRWPARSDVVR